MELSLDAETTLTDLYQTLTEEGSKDLGAALIVGATIEDLDIADLMSHLEDDAINNADVHKVFNALTRGSRNHLRAFTKLLNNQGLTYAPAY